MPLNSNKVTFEQLMAFEAVARLGSFQNAAEELGVQVGALYHFIDRLELALGGKPLRSRKRHGKVRLTVRGKRAYDSARRILRAYQELRTSQLPDVVRVACFPAHALIFESVLFDLRFLDRVHVQFVDGGLRGRDAEAVASQLSALIAVDDSGNAELDVVIAPTTPTLPDGVRQTALYGWKLLAVVPEWHVFYGRKRVPIREIIDGYRLLTSPPGHMSRRRLDQSAEYCREPIPRPYFSASDPWTLRQLGARGVGVPVLPSDSFGMGVDPAWPLVIGYEDEDLGDQHFAYWRADRDEPGVELLIEGLKTIGSRVNLG